MQLFNSARKWTWYWPLITATVILVGCSKIKIPDVEVPDMLPDALSGIIYKIDIQQGNVVTQEMLDKLERGMDKRKVRFILGTPLVVGVFNKDRWDYVYSFQSGGGDREQSSLSLFFENDELRYIKQGNTIKITPKNQSPPVKEDTNLAVP
uniref:Outer membrane protein assembly factor BamE n=1 Tax=Candidatus Kentrum sp. SD TaxID=2126332 RepID=A0A450YCC0_9GAMM|nr:MAG: Outer membrane protein assembly factor BamE, lipoprotein component of the BamABCDE complex [Candidatus Kentron sp. SD]VFK39816.1 MAG: Outer membrane protein assembly factor BamE, lipoprotein component of the BamABCDE complex [Candidatus Kentron sp. SD]VFK78831.1 MAG: Outer membrane protein assembly factor BamE, lipoprotein component of the BamABCDE complex [Candidatus Kentron sp. SD]